MSRTPSKRTDKGAGPSGREVISLPKVDSLLVLVNVREAKKVSAKHHLRNLSPAV
jgi:hypothetical protein